MGRRKKKRQGHYCWSCDRYKPNERFSGRGHARHLCRECAKLGAAELSYRQHVRNIERCLNYDGTVRRKHRNFIQQFLGHGDLRLRAWADQLLTGIGLDDDPDEAQPALYRSSTSDARSTVSCTARS